MTTMVKGPRGLANARYALYTRRTLLLDATTCPTMRRYATLLLALCLTRAAAAQSVRIDTIGLGWARSSVNTVAFRTSSLATYGRVQYAAYYDAESRVVLARRDTGGTRWTVMRTPYANDVTDAHNAIAIAVDGRGVLHVAWADHGRALHYARAIDPGGLEIGQPQRMTGDRERRVTYPQFYALPNGDLLFAYRDGASGNGDVLLNRWETARGTWRSVARPLIAGEGARNAYLNTIAVDPRGGWHVSWTWRESPDVASNHDVLYAYSPDEGRTWQNTSRRTYSLPIREATAEVAWRVPQGSELINQTSMTATANGRPIIATYWRDADSEVPQFRLVWYDGTRWRMNMVGRRTQPFRLSGGGTKRIPVSRPIVVIGRDFAVHVIFRDAERGDGVTIATTVDPARERWRVTTIPTSPLGQWEPTYDPTAWRRSGRLDLLLQRVGQGDGESLEDVPPQPVAVLRWTP